jgi:hypothetical protein
MQSKMQGWEDVPLVSYFAALMFLDEASPRDGLQP